MKRIAFTMKLHKGAEEEYRKRHDAIWPELKTCLRENGISDYSIFLDETSGMLFGALKIGDVSRMQELAAHPVMKRWWSFMKDLMETNTDDSPVSRPLKEVFYLK